jgi:hypothetical protein
MDKFAEKLVTITTIHAVCRECKLSGPPGLTQTEATIAAEKFNWVEYRQFWVCGECADLEYYQRIAPEAKIPF